MININLIPDCFSGVFIIQRYGLEGVSYEYVQAIEMCFVRSPYVHINTGSYELLYFGGSAHWN